MAFEEEILNTMVGGGSSAMGIRQLMEPDSLEEDAEKMIFPSSFMRKRDGKIKG